ncbi:MAG: hypothetical protein ACYC3O_04950 [Burkholderiales bacterium]
MLASLSAYLYRHASWRLILTLILICSGYFWIFNYSALPFSNKALVVAGCGEGLLDIRPYYDAATAYRALLCYGDSGREIYRRFLLADSSFACCYGVAFSLLLSRLLAALTVSAGRWRNANLLPLIVAFVDLAENMLIFSLLALYPHEVPIIADLAGAATLSKWILMLLALTILAASILRLSWRQYRH